MKSLITVNNSDTYTAACLEGSGIIKVPFASLRYYIEDGRLVEVLKNY